MLDRVVRVLGTRMRRARWVGLDATRFAAFLCALSFTRAASAQCRVEAPNAQLPDVTVSVAGQSFKLELNGVTAMIEPQPERSNARVSVTAPLRFTAQYPSSKLRFVLQQAVDLYGGRVRFGKGAMPVWLGPRGVAMRASAPSILGAAVSEPLEVPCRQLALGDDTQYTPPLPLRDPNAPAIGTGSGSFPLFLKPEEHDPLNVAYPGAWQVQQREPGWLLVEVLWTDGSRLHGWTPERNVTDDTFEGEIWFGGGRREPNCVGARHSPPQKATLRKGARIAVSPGGPVWASATEELVVDIYPSDSSARWLQIVSVGERIRNPEHCRRLDNLWTPASDAMRDAAAAPAPLRSGPPPR